MFYGQRKPFVQQKIVARRWQHTQKSHLEKVLKLVSGLIGIFADTLAENDSSLVQEDVTLHRFESEFAESTIPLSFGPHAESSLQEETAQFG